MEGGWDDQAVPLLNATTFGAMYLARGKQPIGMLFHAEISLMQAIEVPCQTHDQQRLTAMYVPSAATWILFAGVRIYELCKSEFNHEDDALGFGFTPQEWLWGKSRAYNLGRWAFGRRDLVKLRRRRGCWTALKT